MANSLNGQTIMSFSWIWKLLSPIHTKILQNNYAIEWTIKEEYSSNGHRNVKKLF